MAVTNRPYHPISLHGLSTDTKPITWNAPGNPNQPVPPGSYFLETDTAESFYFDGNVWTSHLHHPFPWVDIADGHLNGWTYVKKFGYGTVTTTMTPVTSSGTYPTPTSAVSLELVSTDAGDAQNGTGAWSITVEGIDSTGALQSITTSTHATDGTIPVNISGTWLRVFRAYVASSGVYGSSSAGSHIGAITIRVQGAGTTYAQIPLVDSFASGQTFIGAYTIPNGYKGYVFFTDFGVASGKIADFLFFVREDILTVSAPYSPMNAKGLITGISGGTPFNRTGDKQPIPVTGPADIGFMSKVDSTSGIASVEFEVYLRAV